MFSSLFVDAPEYKLRKRTPFKPPEICLSEIRAGIPRHLYKKSTLKGLGYFTRDILSSLILLRLALLIRPTTQWALTWGFNPLGVKVASWAAWAFYFHWQGVVFAGFWCLGHEAGHDTLSNYRVVNTCLGFVLQTFLLTPYFAWRSTHHAHHRATVLIERDENYVPRTRSDFRLPPATKATLQDYHEIFDDVPIYTFGRLLVMQLMGMQLYLSTNALGSPTYPPGTNHFTPSSPLFKPHERNGILASNIGLAVMLYLLWIFSKHVGFGPFICLYGIPYVLANHWIVMLTYLHHSDPTIPYYRSPQWSFVRGALATVDRPFLGWAGRFFLHNVSHDHIAHHINSSIPFYNQPYVTEHLKKLLGPEYNYDSTNIFRALFRSFTECLFIEDEGDIVFYKNKDGKSGRALAEGALAVEQRQDLPSNNRLG